MSGDETLSGERTAPSSRPTLRCAVYTRKSSEEGLEQAFNSLDAQYEACAAYIASQKHEGWKLASGRYDDGGISGGTLERTGLQRLLADIDAGRIGMVVVYKIDRLTRSLADFTRLVERFERAGCSFVSVTQSFNTATSMGRLTLNVLLSFAQFEREVTGERIRDKIAASKKKGLWMGGLVPLGYARHPDPQRRELVPDPNELETVKTLFRLYDELGCLRHVADAAESLGLRSKRRVFPSGRESGGLPFSRGQLHHLLTNPTYLGRVRHRDQSYDGAHPRLIETELWDRVQAKLVAASYRKRGRQRRPPVGVTAKSPAADNAPLTGRLRDGQGNALTPTATCKGNKRYRYYVSHRCIVGRSTGKGDGWRLPASALESMIAKGIADHIARLGASRFLLAPDARAAVAIERSISTLTGRLRSGDQGLLRSLVEEGKLSDRTLSLTLSSKAMATALNTAAGIIDPAVLSLDLPLTLRRRGVELKLVSGATLPSPDRAMIAALARAHRWTDELRRGLSLAVIARREGRSEALVRTRCALAFLSPAIQAAIIEGRHPSELTLERLIRAQIPFNWIAQKKMFGFPEAG